jgi:hypothetical protein
MRKRVIGHGPRKVSAVEPGWLDLERLAQVEITSEDADYPIESALIPGTGLVGGPLSLGSRRNAAFDCAPRTGSPRHSVPDGRQPGEYKGGPPCPPP